MSDLSKKTRSGSKKTRVLVRSWTKKDFRVDTYRGSGPGGQHRNKTDSAVRITDIETGISACCEEGRSQPDNKKIAFRKLVALLMEHHYPTHQKDRAVYTDRVRTYHEPRGTVKDDRTGISYDYEDVLKGKGLGQVIDDCIRHGVNNTEED